jgi:N-formylglutamate amidohydrolase
MLMGMAKHSLKSNVRLLFSNPLTLQVIGTGAGAGVDSAWEQEKLEARKMLENRAESPASSAPWNDGGLSFFTKEHLAV